MHLWDKYDKSSLEFIAGMNYQRYLLRKCEVGDTISLMHYLDRKPIETRLFFDGLAEVVGTTKVFSVKNIQNIEGKFYCEYDDYNQIRG